MKFVPRRLVKTADASRGEQSVASFLKNVLSVVIVLGLGYLALGALGELLARKIPARLEARIFSSVDLDGIESAELEHAREVFGRLVASADLRPLPYRLFAVPGAPNAFALPGGAVGVTQGLLETLESETGLATVLGHELGHHQGRHPLKRLGRALVFRLARSLLFGGGDSVADASLSIAESGYSRRQEREADAFGLRLVHGVYGHTDGSLEFFEMMRHEEATDDLRWAAFMRSHPLTTERIEQLKRLQAQLEQRPD